MRDDLRGEWKIPVRKETTMQRIMEGIQLVIFLRTLIGIGSRLQDELNDWNSKLVISIGVAGVQEERQGGMRVVSGGQGLENDQFEDFS